MIFGKTKLELKVGIFVFTGLMILLIFVLSIGGFKTWSFGYNVKFIFNFINGVKIGAPVRFSGVDVGQVKQIKFITIADGKPKVELVSWVKKEVNIPVDSKVWVNTLGLLGEKYVEVIPGAETSYIGNGQSLNGTDPIAMQEIGELAKKITNDLDAMIVKINKGEGTIGKLMVDDTIYNEIEALVLDLQKHPWKLFWKGKE